jgi:hypothetical protein
MHSVERADRNNRLLKGRYGIYRVVNFHKCGAKIQYEVGSRKYEALVPGGASLYLSGFSKKGLFFPHTSYFLLLFLALPLQITK